MEKSKLKIIASIVVCSSCAFAICFSTNALKKQKNSSVSDFFETKRNSSLLTQDFVKPVSTNVLEKPIATPEPTPKPTAEPIPEPTTEPTPVPTEESIEGTISESAVEETPYTPATTTVWGDVVPASYGYSYGTISCDSIGLYASLIWGDDQSLLNSRAGICQYTGTNQVGYGGCHLLCGHNDSTFALLQYVNIGDTFTISTSYGTYVYQVTSAAAGTVAADASTVYSNSTGAALVNLWDSEDTLYMYTCYPFGYYDATSQRYVVRAVRI